MARRRNLVLALLLVAFLVIIVKLGTDEDVADVDSGFVGENEEVLDENRLLNLDNFRFLLEPNVCAGHKDPQLGIIIVTSYVGHDDVRAAHRKAISQSELKGMGLSRVFLLAQVPAAERFITQSSISSEQRKFGDLLQGNFIESYRNLTYKHLMGLRWAAKKCAHAQYIIKLDDDAVYDIYRLHEYLKANRDRLSSGRTFLAGYVFQHQKPIRLEADKHFVTHDEFPGAEFPKYLSGWLYLTNARTVRLLLKETQRKRFFWIDDTYVTGILAEDQPTIEYTDLTQWFSANPDFIDCCLRDLKRFNWRCEFLVGPNGGDTQLLPLFQRESKKCYQGDNICKDRKGPDQDIRNTCVTEYKDLLRLNHGSAIVRPIKL